MLAEKCGISMSFLGHIERGSRIMSLETFVSICQALDTDADALLWGRAQPSEAVLDMWNHSGQENGKQKKEERNTDSYSMYIRIMKSVAQIMNES